MMRLYLVRHGPTHVKAMVGWADPPADLSNTDQLDRLDRHLPKTAKVVSSDLIRATATADVLSKNRERLPHEPDLREINFGDWDMQVFDTIEDQDRLSAFWDQPGDVSAPNGENWDQVRARVSAAIDRLIAANTGTDLIVVAHFGAILTQVQRALDISSYDAFAHRIDNLSVTELLHTDTGFTLSSVNHLP